MPYFAGKGRYASQTYPQGRGPQGPQGAAGPQGPQGAAGGTLVASGSTVVGAFTAVQVGPFVRVAGQVFVPFAQPQESDVGAGWANEADGTIDYGWRMRNPGPAVTDIALDLQNATGTGRTVDWVVYSFPM